MANIKFLFTISIRKQGNRLWELMKWSPEKICFDLLTKSSNLYYKIKYGDQSGEFERGYWSLCCLNDHDNHHGRLDLATLSWHELYTPLLSCLLFLLRRLISCFLDHDNDGWLDFWPPSWVTSFQNSGWQSSPWQRQRANGRNDSQHCWLENVGSCWIG